MGTALTSLNSISTSLTQANTGANALLVKIADNSISDAQRSQYITEFNQVVSSVANAVDGSTYNGETLVGKVAGTPTAATSKAVINNEAGATSTLNAEDNSGTANTLAGLIGLTFGRTATGTDSFGIAASGLTAAQITAAQTAAAAAIASGGGLSTLQTQVNNQLNQAGADSNYLDAQITFNTSKISSLNAGLGALVDADLSQESAVLQSLQIKQQLGTQALSIANQAPQSLLSLFR